MQQHDIFKNRVPVEQARDGIVDFFTRQKIINVAIATEEKMPIIDSIDYFYFEGEHIAVVPPMSKLAKLIEDGSEFSAFVQEGFGKSAKKFYGDLRCEIVTSDKKIIQKLAATNHMILKMAEHKAKFLRLNILKGIISLSHQEVYDITSDLIPTFAKFAANGKERFENSRQVLMNYLDRSVIFSVIIEDGVYYCLAKSDSNKMEYIKKGGICKFFDGKYNHFESKINIVDEKKDSIFEKLVATNNAFFKENVDLVALSFTKGE